MATLKEEGEVMPLHRQEKSFISSKMYMCSAITDPSVPGKLKKTLGPLLLGN